MTVFTYVINALLAIKMEFFARFATEMATVAEPLPNLQLMILKANAKLFSELIDTLRAIVKITLLTTKPIYLAFLPASLRLILLLIAPSANVIWICQPFCHVFHQVAIFALLTLFFLKFLVLHLQDTLF